MFGLGSGVFSIYDLCRQITRDAVQSDCSIPVDYIPGTWKGEY